MILTLLSATHSFSLPQRTATNVYIYIYIIHVYYPSPVSYCTAPLLTTLSPASADCGSAILPRRIVPPRLFRFNVSIMRYPRRQPHGHRRRVFPMILSCTSSARACTQSLPIHPHCHPRQTVIGGDIVVSASSAPYIICVHIPFPPTPSHAYVYCAKQACVSWLLYGNF